MARHTRVRVVHPHARVDIWAICSERLCAARNPVTMPHMSSCSYSHTTLTVYEAVFSAVTGTPRPVASIVAEVCAATGVAAGTVSSQLSEMVAGGVLLRPSRGMYCLNTTLLTPEMLEELGAGW
jgi:hypothetical protein